jgi:hypothetical protein
MITIVPGYISKPKTLEKPDSQVQPRSVFWGAFYCSGATVSGLMTLQVDRGYVNGLEPVTSKNELIGGTDIYQPFMQFQPSYDDLGRAYICIKMAIDPITGLMKAQTQKDVTPATLTIDVMQTFISSDPAVHYHPIAIDHKDHGFKQMTYHDYLHVSIKQYAVYRHFMIAS